MVVPIIGSAPKIVEEQNLVESNISSEPSLLELIKSELSPDFFHHKLLQKISVTPGLNLVDELSYILSAEELLIEVQHKVLDLPLNEARGLIARKIAHYLRSHTKYQIGESYAEQVIWAFERGESIDNGLFLVK